MLCTMKNNNKSYKYDMKEMYKRSDPAKVTNNRLDLNVFTHYTASSYHEIAHPSTERMLGKYFKNVNWLHIF